MEDPYCKGITAGTKAQELFEILDIFMIKSTLERTECFGTCSDLYENFAIEGKVFQ